MATLKKNTKSETLNPKQPEVKKTDKKVKVNLTALSVDEVHAEIKKVRTELNSHAVATFSGKEKNLRKNFVLRKQLARLLTILSQKKV